MGKRMKYYLSDIDTPYAMDEGGNEYYVLGKDKFSPAPKGTIDPYWGGVTKKEAVYWAEQFDEDYEDFEDDEDDEEGEEE